MTAWGQAKFSEATAVPCADLNCWGDFGLTDPASEVDLKPRGRKARALLAYLAFHPGKPVSRERLTGLLWGDRGEEQARASLRQAILELKPLSGPDRAAIIVERDHLLLRSGSISTDIDRLRQAFEAGDYAELSALIPERDERLFANLDGLDEAFDDWLLLERARQTDALITLIADASAAALSQGQVRAARALHARRCEFDPAAESLVAAPSETPPSASPVPSAPQAAAQPRRLRRWPIVAVAFACLMAAALGLWIMRPRADGGVPTVAVLPFTGVAAENSSFAKGLSEEITSQLARQQGLRVAGRASAAQLRAQNADLRQIGRRLHVGYVLEGSVRSVGDRVRVNVALTKTSDGMQFWSEAFDGTLDDILAIQYRIGANVAKALTQRLVSNRIPTGALATNGQVYSLYLTARGLIRERNPEAWVRARTLLERAVKLDPNFAPGWSSLAQAEYPGDNSPNAVAALRQATAHAQRALELAPDLAEAHGVLGMIRGFDDPVGAQHIKRAAELDPNNAEYQYWLGNVYAEQAKFRPMLDAYRRSFAIDPLFTRSHEYLVMATWSMGYQDEARAIVRQVESDGSAAQAHEIRAIFGRARGDLSEAAKEYRLARNVASDAGRRASLDWRRGMLLEQLRLFDASYALRRQAGEKLPPARTDPYVTIMTGSLPSAGDFQKRNRNIAYSWRDLGFVGRAAKQLINAGRAREVAAEYDHGGVLRISSSAPKMSSRFFEDGPVVAAALRSVGREQEADRLLSRLDREIAFAKRKSGGQVPARFLAAAAGTWAMQGKVRLALSALEKARGLGWDYISDMDDSSLPDIGDEPAFRSLREQSRFEVLRARLNAELARERRETVADGSAVTN